MKGPDVGLFHALIGELPPPELLGSRARDSGLVRRGWHAPSGCSSRNDFCLPIMSMLTLQPLSPGQAVAPCNEPCPSRLYWSRVRCTTQGACDVMSLAKASRESSTGGGEFSSWMLRARHASPGLTPHAREHQLDGLVQQYQAKVTLTALLATRRNQAHTESV